MVGWLVLLFVFYGISTFLGYLMPNPFYTIIYFKQFNLAWVHSLIVKSFLFQAIPFSQTVIIQTIQFSMSIDFVYTPFGMMVRVFANAPGDLGSIPGRVIPYILDASLLNTQHYKVRLKGKVEQSRERSSAIPYTLV